MRQHSQNFVFFTVFNTLQNTNKTIQVQKMTSKECHIHHPVTKAKTTWHNHISISLSHDTPTLHHFDCCQHTLNTKRIDVKRYYIPLPVTKLKLHDKTAFLSHCVPIQPWPDTVAWTK